MILLQESTYFLRMSFNERFLQLRSLKARTIENIARDNQRLREIAHLLGLDPEQDMIHVAEDPTEWPERRLEYTQDDLDEFVRKEKEEAEKKEKAKRSQFFHTVVKFFSRIAGSALTQCFVRFDTMFCTL